MNHPIKVLEPNQNAGSSRIFYEPDGQRAGIIRSFCEPDSEMQELQSRVAGIIRMCYDMHGENAGISVIFVNQPVDIQGIMKFSCEPQSQNAGTIRVVKWACS